MWVGGVVLDRLVGRDGLLGQTECVSDGNCQGIIECQEGVFADLMVAGDVVDEERSVASEGWEVFRDNFGSLIGQIF